MSQTNSSSPCYQFENNKIQQDSNWLPCGPWTSSGPVLSCCRVGDYCMSDSICHSKQTGNGGSGYYQGACTDSQYENALCPSHCSDQLYLDVKYNTTLSEWQCCGSTSDGDVSCDSPTTDDFFDAPVPSKLSTTASAGQTTLPPQATETQSQASSTSSTSFTSSSTATSTAAASSGLSTGATAGIAAGAAVIGLIALGFLVWFLLRKRRQKKEAEEPRELAADGTTNAQMLEDTQPNKPGDGYYRPAEADSAPIHELDMPQDKMYYDYAKNQWMMKRDDRLGIARLPTELSADQIARVPTELSAETRPVELPGHKR